MEKTTNQEFPKNDIPQNEQIALCGDLKNGSRDAFAKLIELSQKQLYGIIWRMLRNHEDTDDVLQDTYLRLFEKKHKLHTDRPIMPYLRRIAVNLSINKLKATKRLISIDTIHELPDGYSTERAAEQNEMLVMTRKAISKLPKEQQLVLMLRIQEGLSYQEIAEALQLRLGTVMSRLARAREKIVQFVRKNQTFQKAELLQ
ncbi:MAG: RNA polymerase sigma factor [bacterium]